MEASFMIEEKFENLKKKTLLRKNRRCCKNEKFHFNQNDDSSKFVLFDVM